MNKRCRRGGKGHYRRKCQFSWIKNEDNRFRSGQSYYILSQPIGIIVYFRSLHV